MALDSKTAEEFVERCVSLGASYCDDEEIAAEKKRLIAELKSALAAKDAELVAVRGRLAEAVGLLRPFAAEWERRDEVPPKIGYVIGDLFAAYNWLAQHDAVPAQKETT